MEEILRSVYTVAAAGQDKISQTVPSPPSGNLQSDGLGNISPTESSPSSGNLQSDGLDIISQTVSSPSSGNLQSDIPCIISQTESSPSTGNLQTLVERIFRLDRIAWKPDSFLDRVGLKLEQKYFRKNYLRHYLPKKATLLFCDVMPRNDRLAIFLSSLLK